MLTLLSEIETMRKIIKMIGILLLIMLGVFAYQANQLTIFLNDLDDCLMMDGPIYGKSISLNAEDLEMEQEIKIPNGKLGFLNLSDSLAPKMLKFDDLDNLIWAITFQSDSLENIPHQKLSEMALIKEKNEVVLSFFNYSVGEPGKIYLTKGFDFKYMCLSAW